MKNSRAAVKSRQHEILEYMRIHGAGDVNKLAMEFRVTPTTIRRDLNVLQKENYISRCFGGARLQEPVDTEEISPTDIRDEKEFIRKEIARLAADQMCDGEIIFMNSSATASLVLGYLGEKNVTVVTNNSRAIDMPRSSRTQLLLTGGAVYGKKQSLVGELAHDTISKITATACILGVSGISSKEGITSRILQETTINRMMLERCTGAKIVVAEGSKIGVSHSFYSGSIEDITCLITDSSASEEALKEIRDRGVNVILTD
ncbi:DeoR/GlpR family DNA-binding transcription regulator [Blautia schinkii]|nr:DeoR/GlpR family DNA-binding transcription regulator [Blautia schinkii]